jgi:hypothetical protein
LKIEGNIRYLVVLVSVVVGTTQEADGLEADRFVADYSKTMLVNLAYFVHNLLKSF